MLPSKIPRFLDYTGFSVIHVAGGWYVKMRLGCYLCKIANEGVDKCKVIKWLANRPRGGAVGTWKTIPFRCGREK